MVVLSQIFGEQLTVWVIVPLLIFFARIIDVSIGTMRLIFISKGMKLLAPLLAFFEVLVWLAAMGAILKNLTSWQNFIAFSMGFAAGNYVGMFIENKLALGNVLIRVITQHDAGELLDALHDMRLGVTSIEAEGKDGPVKVLFTVVARTSIPKILDVVNRHNPHAFYSIEDIRYVREGFSSPKVSQFHNLDIITRKIFRLRK